jgi:hypothetical protein
MFLACWWLARRGAREDARKVALAVWLAYVVIDLAIVFAVGVTARIVVLSAISQTLKLAAAWAGAAAARRRRSREM